MKRQATEVPGPPSNPLAALLHAGGEDRSPERYPHPPTPDGVLAAAPAALLTSAPRDAVVNILRGYNREIGNPHGEELCQRLADPRAIVITTGQQPGVFGGPMMVFAKAAGTSLLAASLEASWDGPVVPLFWNHSEDHDLDEIRTLTVFRQGSPARLKAPLSGRGLCFDHVPVSQDLVSFARDVLAGAALRGGNEGLLPRAGEPFPKWTARVMLHLLHGMPLLQAEPYLFRPLVGEVFERAITDVEALGAAARAGARAVADLGHEPQVKVTDSSQLFLVGNGGQRARLRHHDDSWRLTANEGFEPGFADALDATSLVERVRSHPQGFSVNVLLRTAVLQHVLPVACHVCGPAEVSYFAQLPELFAWAGRPVPAVVPRPSVTLLGPGEEAVRQSLGLQASQLLQAPETWPVGSGDEGGSGRERHRLAQWVRPRGRPQERVFGPLALLVDRDPAILGAILADLDPWEARHQVITLEESDPHVP